MGFNLADLSRKITGDVPVFGFASDGNATISGGTTTLTTVAEYRDLTISSTGILKPVGYMIYVTGTLTIEEGGVIRNNGANASGATGGGVVGAGNTFNGGQGMDGDIADPALFQTQYIGGLSGDSGAGSAGAGETQVGVNSVQRSGKLLTTMPGLLIPSALSSTKASCDAPGGNGDGAANAGGGGGGGGGCIWIVAANIINYGTIEANGGNGAAGTANNCGGGAGAGGGYIHIVTRSYMGDGTIQCLGGTGGASGGGAGVAGTAGSAGVVHTLVVP